MTTRQALGKGLEALIPMQGDIDQTPSVHKNPAELPVESILPNPFQPRLEFDPKELDELAASIKEKGIVQPVMVRTRQDGKYELVAGERRFRAAKLAGLAQIPAIVRDVNDTECLEIALIENIQRSNLNSIEAALAYNQLMNQFDLTQEEMAKRVGKDRSSVANTLRLLKLPGSVQEMVKKNRISEGHARALLGVNDESMIERLAEKVVRDNLTVRDVERIAQGIRPEKTIQPNKAASRRDIKDPHTRELEEELRRKLGTQVKVLPRSGQKGKIEIEYYSLEDLDRILALLG